MSPLSLALQETRIAVIGGGASGIFSAIAAAESLRQKYRENAISKATPPSVTVWEGGSKTLTKVKISGGGRCNVMHDTSKPVSQILTEGYPRGFRELNGIYNKRFGPTDAQAWFESRGVTLKTEGDGRMFPTTDSSQTIMDTLMEAADQAGVVIRTRCKVSAIEAAAKDSKDRNARFQVTVEDKLAGAGSRVYDFDAVILATGSLPAGYKLVQSLGHSLVTPVASLFTLSTKHSVQEGGILHGLSGLSVQHAHVSFRLSKGGPKSNKKKTIHQEGPLLITHHGLSGPAALRLSSFGARELADHNYRGPLVVHWAPSLGNQEQIAESLWKMTALNPKKRVGSVCPLLLPDGSGSALPKRLWSAMALQAGFEGDTVWGQAPKKLVRKLAAQVSDCSLEMTSKGTFKEEFVTAGGVNLKEIDMKSMQSKQCPGLFFCGELINVDGVTGGFNFMNCWSTGYVAGTAAAEYVAQQQLGSLAA